MHDRPTRFSWGLVLLASMYKDLHEYIYLDDKALRASVKLLHVWAWEHIAVLRPQVVVVLMGPDDPLVWHYRGGVSFTHTCEHEIPFWRRVLDDMQVFTWHLYLGRPRWADDVHQIFYACQDRFMQGRKHMMIERYLPWRVQR